MANPPPNPLENGLALLAPFQDHPGLYAIRVQLNSVSAAGAMYTYVGLSEGQKDALYQLVQAGRLHYVEMAGRYVYFTTRPPN